MNFFNIENKMDSTCLQKVDNNLFKWTDIECLIQLYEFISDKIYDLEDENKTSGVEFEKLSSLHRELLDIITRLQKKYKEYEEDGYDIAFYKDKEPNIQLKNLKKEDIFYTPPRLEYLSAKQVKSNKNKAQDYAEDFSYAKETGLLDNVPKYNGGKVKSRKNKNVKSKTRKHGKRKQKK